MEDISVSTAFQKVTGCDTIACLSPYVAATLTYYSVDGLQNSSHGRLLENLHCFSST